MSSEGTSVRRRPSLWVYPGICIVVVATAGQIAGALGAVVAFGVIGVILTAGPGYRVVRPPWRAVAVVGAVVVVCAFAIFSWQGAFAVWRSPTAAFSSPGPFDGHGRQPGEDELRDADLRGADLEAARLNRADLRWRHLDGARLRGATLAEANLLSASLRGADLHDADLTNACLAGAVLDGADLTGARVDGAAVRVPVGQVVKGIPAPGGGTVASCG